MVLQKELCPLIPACVPVSPADSGNDIRIQAMFSGCILPSNMAQSCRVQIRSPFDHTDISMAVFDQIIHCCFHCLRFIGCYIECIYIHLTADHNHRDLFLQNFLHKCPVFRSLA